MLCLRQATGNGGDIGETIVRSTRIFKDHTASPQPTCLGDT
jgi:hypothetical protein